MSRRFWSEMSWKIAVAVRPVSSAVAVGVRRGDADRESARSAVVIDAFGARRADPFARQRSSASASSGATLTKSLEHRLADLPVELDAEQLLGHRVGVEQAAVMRRR